MTPSSSPFSALSDILNQLRDKLSEALRPPAWLTQEAQNRLVLFLNHVLMQEPQAQARLAGQTGRVVRLQWRALAMQLRATPAGLCELAPDAAHDLLLTVVDDSPLALARGALRGERPAVRIEGDVQLAGDINWLVDNLRWDVEDDLARVVGGAAAHQIARVGHGVADAVRRFASGLPVGKNGRGDGAAAQPWSADSPSRQPDPPNPPKANP
jgi:ubiquinone biosynthesis protein UbiJ